MLARLVDDTVDVMTRRLRNLVGDVMLDPRRCLELRVWIAHQVALLPRPRTPHHLPRIARQVLAMNNQRPDCALPRRFFKLVRPSSVVGQRLALEEIWV